MAQVSVKNAYDSDLVFEDDGSPTKATLGLAKPLLLDEADRERGRPLMSAVGADFDDSAEPWGDKPFSHEADVDEGDEFEDESETEEEEDEDENEKEDESANDVALPGDDGEQGWLMRSMKRIKRSLNSLWSDSSDAHHPLAEEDHIVTKLGEGKRKKKASQKPRKPKNKKKKQQQQQARQEERQLKNARRQSPAEETPVSGRNGKLPAAKPNAIPPYASGKSSRMGVNRPKRQHDDGLEDIEGSGSGFGEGSGDLNGRDDRWTSYHMEILHFTPFQRSMQDPRQNGEMVRVIREQVKRLLDEALQTDFVVTMKQLDAYPPDNMKTLVKVELQAPKEFDVYDMEDKILNQLKVGFSQLLSDGLKLSLVDDNAALDPDDNGLPTEDSILDPIDSDDDDYLTERPFESGEDNEGPGAVPDRTPDEPKDLCRGDDKVPCGDSSVFICEVQQCDGRRDCPNGEDETPELCKYPVVCRENQFKCDSKCIEMDQKCDRIPDCNDGTDEADCTAAREAGSAGSPDRP
uniref:SEA domain-containing protein n=1 Tax=Anopheles atroparvus TaxID=41427 RepID=A0A182IZ73_ANOAO